MEKAPFSKQPRHDATFYAKTLRLANENRSTLATARALNLNAKLLYQWQKAAQQPLPTNPQETAEVRASRAQVRQQTQELEISKKTIAIFSTTPTP